MGTPKDGTSSIRAQLDQTEAPSTAAKPRHHRAVANLPDFRGSEQEGASTLLRHQEEPRSSPEPRIANSYAIAEP